MGLPAILHGDAATSPVQVCERASLLGREEVGVVALDLVRTVLRVRGEGLVEILGTLEVTPKR